MPRGPKKQHGRQPNGAWWCVRCGKTFLTEQDMAGHRSPAGKCAEEYILRMVGYGRQKGVYSRLIPR